MVLNREKYYRWSWLFSLFAKPTTELGGVSANREKLYGVAYSFLGKDASPRDIADDDLACAESVNAVYKAAFGHEIGGDVSTLRLYEALRKSAEFQEVSAPLFGDIIISPTTLARQAHGHVGIVGKWQVMSNNSLNGLWDAHYTLESWRLRYGFVKYFRCVESPEAPPGVKEIVDEGVKVAAEAVKYPELRSPVMVFLATLGAYLKSLISQL